MNDSFIQACPPVVDVDDPSVFRMSQALGIDGFGVLGRPYAVWRWKEKYEDEDDSTMLSRAINMPTLIAMVDHIANLPGFGKAMIDERWITEDNGRPVFQR